MLLTGTSVPVIQHTPHYSYEFTCGACASGSCTAKNKHSLACLDWELGEAMRKWKEDYPDIDDYNKAIQNKFFENMIDNKDLYFFMGTHFRFKTWMIIGLYYPPKKKNMDLFSFK